jgi:hypothetical protein
MILQQPTETNTANFYPAKNTLFTFDSYSLAGFRDINDEPIFDDKVEGTNKGQHVALRDRCRKEVEDYYLTIFLTSETGTEVYDNPTARIVGTDYADDCAEAFF